MLYLISYTKKIREGDRDKMATGIPSPKQFNDNLDFEISYKNKEPKDKVLKNKNDVDIINLFNSGEESTNAIYYGDNLDVLKKLMNNPSVKGKVKLIYIDPPYAKQQKFSSRSQEHAYDDVLVGARYLEFMRQRLIVMRELLAPDGSIYVHLDETMAFPMKLIMDEVFGTKNFRNWITRKKSNPKNSTSKKFGSISDYILFYTKTSKYVFNKPYTPWTKELGEKEYNYTEKETGRRYKKVPIHAPGVRNGETGKEWRGMLPPEGKHWQYTPSKLDEMDERGEIFWSKNGNPRRKIYLDQSPGIAFQDIWLDYKDAHNQNIEITGYPTEKNLSMLELIVKTATNEGDIVLDAFAGSGTSLVAAENLNRHWIGIDNSKLAITTMLKRLSHGSEKMGDFVQSKNKVSKQEAFVLTTETKKNFSFYVTNQIFDSPIDLIELKKILNV